MPVPYAMFREIFSGMVLLNPTDSERERTHKMAQLARCNTMMRESEGAVAEHSEDSLNSKTTRVPLETHYTNLYQKVIVSHRKPPDRHFDALMRRRCNPSS